MKTSNETRAIIIPAVAIFKRQNEPKSIRTMLETSRREHSKHKHAVCGVPKHRHAVGRIIIQFQESIWVQWGIFNGLKIHNK
eukprot:UN02579